MAASNKQNDRPTTGHSWDGIEEFDNPLPRWWLWIFYACILWSVVYWILYPAWPMVRSATAGVLGYSSRADVAAEIAAADQANQVWYNQLMDSDIDAVASNNELERFAVNAGAAVFRAQCSQCHGAGANGLRPGSGFPNLLDDEWMWGGTLADIEQTVTHGIRNSDYPDARYSEMPSFGRDELLNAEEIDQVVHFVLQLSGQPHDAALSAPGEQLFADNCVACHGENGAGDPFVGAPALNNGIWLYGGSADEIRASVTNANFGIMPGFANRVNEAQIRAVAIYVHGLGGGQ